MAKWAKGSGRPSGDECYNRVATVSGTLGGGSGNRGWCNNLDTSGAFIPVVAGTLTGPQGDAGPDENDAARGKYVAHTFRGEGFDASEDGTGRGTPLVTAFHGSQDPDVSGDVTHPVGRNQGQETCVAYSIQENAINRSDGAGARGKGWFRDESPTLGGNGKTHAVAFTQNQDGDVLTGDVAPALGTNANATGRNTAKVVHGGVRRLTPIECERLQGLPDDYTRIPWRGKPACECPDGPRYKAIGNGMAAPCVEWIFRRIDAAWRKDGKVHEGDG